MPLSNCKIELKLKWRNYCVLSAADSDNTNANPNNIILTIKNTKLYVPSVTLKVKDNQKLSNFLAKKLKDQFIVINIKQKGITKIPQMNTDMNQILLESIY